MFGVLGSQMFCIPGGQMLGAPSALLRADSDTCGRGQREEQSSLHDL